MLNKLAWIFIKKVSSVINAIETNNIEMMVENSGKNKIDLSLANWKKIRIVEAKIAAAAPICNE